MAASATAYQSQTPLAVAYATTVSAVSASSVTLPHIPVMVRNVMRFMLVLAAVLTTEEERVGRGHLTILEVWENRDELTHAVEDHWVLKAV